MRTNIFLTSNSIASDFVADVNAMTTDIALMKAKTHGTVLDKQFNLVWKGGDSRYANLGNREIRVIPISLCELYCKDTEQKIAKYDDGAIVFILNIADDYDFTNIIGQDITVRVILPAKFNKRNSWNFSYRVAADTTVAKVRESIYNQIKNSSIKEWVDMEIIEATGGLPPVTTLIGIKFYMTEYVNNVYVHPMDATLSSWINVVTSVNDTNKVELVTRAFLRKLIVDADANYGFDYINCPDGDFYPNKLRPREVDFMLDTLTNVVENVFGGTLGLTHITFVEPRIVETTGDVVKQVINIVHPLKDVGDFVYNDFKAMINKIAPGTFGD